MVRSARTMASRQAPRFAASSAALLLLAAWSAAPASAARAPIAGQVDWERESVDVSACLAVASFGEQVLRRVIIGKTFVEVENRVLCFFKLYRDTMFGSAEDSDDEDDEGDEEAIDDRYRLFELPGTIGAMSVDQTLEAIGYALDYARRSLARADRSRDVEFSQIPRPLPRDLAGITTVLEDDVEFIDVFRSDPDPRKLARLTLVADFLNFPALLQLGQAALASMIRGRTMGEIEDFFRGKGLLDPTPATPPPPVSAAAVAARRP